MWPDERDGLWWEWPDERDGLWWEWPDERDDLWWAWSDKRGETTVSYLITLKTIKFLQITFYNNFILT
jgi:hypothetical protein